MQIKSWRIFFIQNKSKVFHQLGTWCKLEKSIWKHPWSQTFCKQILDEGKHTDTDTPPKRDWQPNIQWARNTKYSLLNIQNFCETEFASRVVNFPILHTSSRTFLWLHNKGQNTISSNFKLKKPQNLSKWKTWKRIAPHKCRVTSMCHCSHLCTCKSWDGDETVHGWFRWCFKLTG